MNSDKYLSKNLEYLLKEMDIPPNRRRICLNNLKWLDKNLKTRNSGHPNYPNAAEIITYMLENKLYDY